MMGAKPYGPGQNLILKEDFRQPLSGAVPFVSKHL